MALSVSYPFGNPRFIPLPTRLGCTIIHNLCLRSTLCDAVVLFTVWREIVLIKAHVLKLSFIYTMYNLYPLLIFMLVINSRKLHCFERESIGKITCTGVRGKSSRYICTGIL